MSRCRDGELGLDGVDEPDNPSRNRHRPVDPGVSEIEAHRDRARERSVSTRRSDQVADGYH